LIISFNIITWGNPTSFKFEFLLLLGDQSCTNSFLSEILIFFFFLFHFNDPICFMSLSIKLSFFMWLLNYL
jgi:hypothetical protein